MADNNGTQSPEDQIRSLYERMENGAAQASEAMVAKPSFGGLLTMATENLAAVTRMTADLADLTLRNLRIAGRADITRLAKQLNRNEDKLERVLQEVESLRDEIAEQRSTTGVE